MDSVWYCEEDNLLKVAWFSAYPAEVLDLTGAVWKKYKRRNSFAGRKWICIGVL